MNASQLGNTLLSPRQTGGLRKEGTAVRCWMFDVGCSMFPHVHPRGSQFCGEAFQLVFMPSLVPTGDCQEPL
jgi:hypothetical protein